MGAGMKRFCDGVLFFMALLIVLLGLPNSARADYMYTFSGFNFSGGVSSFEFSFDEPSLITTTGAFTTSFTVGSTTFTNGYFLAGSDCFAFATFSLSSCGDPGPTSFYSIFPGATAVGTYGFIGGACDPAPGAACLGALKLEISSNSVPTPEPSSFVLLGSGLLGFAGVVRRRLS
jgi:hypothetical protein